MAENILEAPPSLLTPEYKKTRTGAMFAFAVGTMSDSMEGGLINTLFPVIAKALALDVGALGTLTFNVMANTMLLKARRAPAGEPLLVWGTTLIGIATACRVAAALVSGGALELLTAAAGCWSAAFLILLWLIARSRGERTEHLTQRRARSDG